MPASPGPPPVDLFLSYAHKDQELCDQLREHLSALRRAGIVNDWHDRQIEAGGDWSSRIDDRLDRAHVVLFLVSSAFLGSDYCQEVEVQRAMERHRAGDAVVVPVVLRDCEWRDAPFGHLNPLPRRHRAVTLAPDRDEAMANVARELKDIIRRRWADATVPPPDRTAVSVTGTAAGRHQTLAIRPTRLFIVVQRDLRTGPVFNMDGTVTNSGAGQATVRRLDAQLSDPHDSSFRMRWHLFYRYVRPGVMDKESDPRPLTVAPHARREVGIQFLAPASVRDYDWPIGTYRFDLLGWTGEPLDSSRPDFARRYEIAIDPRISEYIRQWATAPDERWIALNDPHDAVGVPVEVRERH